MVSIANYRGGYSPYLRLEILADRVEGIIVSDLLGCLTAFSGHLLFTQSVPGLCGGTDLRPDQPQTSLNCI